LKAASVPKPPPEPIPEPPKEPQPPAPKPAPKPEPALPTPTPTPNQGATQTSQGTTETAKQTQTPQAGGASVPKPAFPASGLAPQTNGAAPTQSSPFGVKQAAPQTQQTPKPNGLPQPAAAPPKQPATAVQTNRQAALVTRYSQIHQELKKLRKNLQAMAKTSGPPLKTQMGVFRREIRTSIGQLTGGKGANVAPVSSTHHITFTCLT
jgi:nucleoporin GLE1